MSFEIIPVLDLKNGLVVRAQLGNRHLYAPIKSPLAPTSEPADVVAGLLNLHPFEKLYIADLDAIEGRGNQSGILTALEERFPRVHFCVDAGIATKDQAALWLASHRADLVLGSENLAETDFLENLRHSQRILLSLDFRGDIQQGPAQIFENPGLWPHRLIVMTLGRVGSHAGPDMDKLASVMNRAKTGHAVYAAGGVRHRGDLEALRKLGAAGVLIASALHDGTLTTSDLRLDG